jgi:hypothetical protein
MNQYIIFNVTEISLIDFSQVLETSQETIRLSLDGSKTFVNWEAEEIPSCIDLLTSKEGPYSYEEMVAILEGSEWSSSDV